MFLRLGRLARSCGRNALILFHACRQPETPLSVKAASLLLALYVISPIDLIPDIVPLLGWLDDATLLAFALPAILKMVPAQAIGNASVASERTMSKWQFWRK